MAAEAEKESEGFAPEKYGPFRRVLFCTDFSENADFAFQFAVEEAARTPGSTLHLLHVIPEPDAQFWKTYIYEVEEIDRKARADIDAKIAKDYLHHVPNGMDVQVEIRIGKDYIRILEYAEEMDADLIIIGRHGRTAFGKVLFGNVTEKVARKAGCPVLIIPLSFERAVERNEEEGV